MPTKAQAETDGQYFRREVTEKWKLTIKKGATIQFTTTLKPICFQSALFVKSWCRDSYWTLHRMGYIMTRSPTAIQALI